MSESGKSIWTRRHSLPNLWPLVAPRMLRRYFFCLVCLATLIALFYAEEDLRGKFAWERYRRQSKAKGVDLDWRSYIPPAVPDDQNFAMTPPFKGFFDYVWTTNNTDWRDTNIWDRVNRVSISSIPLAQKLGDWVNGHEVDLGEWRAYLQNAAKSTDTNRWLQFQNGFQNGRRPTNHESAPVPRRDAANDVLLALGRLEPDLEALRNASHRPQSRFPIHYQELPKALLVHLGYLANLSRIAELRAVAELESGRNQEAMADVHLAFYCADAVKSDACLCSQVVRCQIIEHDLQPVWEGLSAHRWTEDQLKDFQRYFSKIDLLLECQESVQGDMAFTCAWIDSIPADPLNFFLTVGRQQDFDDAQAAVLSHALPRGWFYQNELSAARLLGGSLQADVAPQAQRVYPNLSRANADAFDKLPRTFYTFGLKQVGGVVSPQEFARAQTEINCALVACALERFRMAHGGFPETLDALAPAFLEKLPHDVIDGQPLHYRLTGAGRFILYSVGWNEKDDGGAFPGPDTANFAGGVRGLVKYHPETGDWVWEYPANRVQGTVSR